MPELPEVETTVRTLRPLVVGQRMRRVSHVRADMVSPIGFDLAATLRLRTITQVARRAKRIVFTLDSGDCFFIHLGMTGRLVVIPATQPVAPHTHLMIDLSDGIELRLSDPRRFGAIVWLGRTDHVGLGPEPLTLEANRLMKLLATTKRAIKTALLDQKLLAGVGNIYADEALHRAGIDPRTPAHTLTRLQAQKLNSAIKYVLRRAIRAGGSSIRDYVDADGRTGSFQKQHAVYDRANQPCRTCSHPIQRIVLGGRATHFCKKCQR